jgi:hypothetical protein
LSTGFFAQHPTVPAVKTVEFVTDKGKGTVHLRTGHEG